MEDRLMVGNCDVAIIGAEPYGLSIAAWLREAGVNFRIFGTPMQTWRTQMLKHSHLKSEGFASSLYEPSGTFTLEHYCAASGLPYQNMGLPVPRTTFQQYALAFQRRYVPNLEQKDIVDLAASDSGFVLTAADGEIIAARRVVVATGISRFQYLPPELEGLPSEFVTHSAAHSTVERFSGQDVIVVGAGASAVDMAAELLKEGARVRIVTRRSRIDFHDPPRERGLVDMITNPISGLGPGWRSRLCTDAPLLFHVMPEAFRVKVVRKHLGPAPCWFTRDAVEGKAEFILKHQLRGAVIEDDKVRLTLAYDDGEHIDLVADHVVSATGYRVDLKRLGFLPDTLRSRIRLCDTSPALSMNFESSVRGLYFVGTAAANSFGPVSRFAFGARFTAARLSGHLARQKSTGSVLAMEKAA
jgi:cation diffusion facilitator CzcD-associated flavoprotein CzcO